MTTIIHKTLSVPYVRNFIFGVEDGLASTVGFLAGIATAGVIVGNFLQAK